MSSSTCSSGKARARSMLSWVMPAGQQAQGSTPSTPPAAPRALLPRQAGRGALTTAGHGRLQAVQCLLVLTQVIGHVPVRVDCQEVGTTAGRVDGALVTGPFSPSGGPQDPLRGLPPRAASEGPRPHLPQ